MRFEENIMFVFTVKMDSLLERFSCKKKTLFSNIRIFIYVGKIYGLAPYSYSALSNQQKNDCINTVISTITFLGKFDNKKLNTT